MSKSNLRSSILLLLPPFLFSRSTYLVVMCFRLLNLLILHVTLSPDHGGVDDDDDDDEDDDDDDDDEWVWLLPKCSSIHIKASTKTERHWAKKRRGYNYGWVVPLLPQAGIRFHEESRGQDGNHKIMIRRF
jgi:hypothetical protein